MKSRGKTILLAFLLLIFAGSIYMDMSMGWSSKALMMPLIIASCGMAVSGVLLGYVLFFPEIFGKGNGKMEGQVISGQDVVSEDEDEVLMLFFIAALTGMILMLGFWIAMGVGFVLFMAVIGRESWKVTVIFTVMSMVTIYMIVQVGLGVSLYGGMFGLSISL